MVNVNCSCDLHRFQKGMGVKDLQKKGGASDVQPELNNQEPLHFFPHIHHFLFRLSFAFFWFYLLFQLLPRLSVSFYSLPLSFQSPLGLSSPTY